MCSLKLVKPVQKTDMKTKDQTGNPTNTILSDASVLQFIERYLKLTQGFLFDESVETAYAQVVSSTQTLFQPRASLLVIKNRDTDVYEWTASSGIAKNLRQTYDEYPILKKETPWLFDLLQQEKTIQVSQLEEHLSLREIFAQTQQGIIAALLKRNDQIFGILWLQDPGEETIKQAGQIGFYLFGRLTSLYLGREQVMQALQSQKQEVEKLTSELVKSEKLAMAGQMAGVVAHQVRNPLSVINGHLQMMLAELKEDSPMAATMETLCQKIRETDQTIRGLMELSRPLELNMRKATLVSSIETVRTYIRTKCEKQQVELVVGIPTELPKVWFDERQLQKCVLDICTNALQAMPEGGKLALAAASFGKRVEIRIQDSGSGLPKEVISRIFEPFFTTRTQGKGLGLYNVKRICDEMGVELSARNAQGGGALFKMEFQVSAEKPAPLFQTLRRESKRYNG